MRARLAASLASTMLVASVASASPAGGPPPSWLLVFERGDRLATIAPDGSGLQELAVLGEAPDWAPDGHQLAYMRATSSAEADYRIYVAALDGAERRLSAGPGLEFQPAWSPDGGRIAFSDENRNIFSVAVDGSGRRRLTRSWGIDLVPAWSPDGTRIAYVGQRHCSVRYLDTCSTEIFVMNADGSDKRRLTRNTVGDAGPAWSPDGTRIAFLRFARRARGPFALFVMDADGSGESSLTGFERGLYTPTWSPDGSRLAFEAADDLWTMRRDGSDLRNITGTPDVIESVPDWGTALR